MSRTLQPALIIGTGGSGLEVLRRFKRRFRDVYPETPYVQLMGVDTAAQEQLSRDAPPLAQDEFVHASIPNMAFFVGDEFIDRHPHIRTWWRGFDNIPLRAIQTGAGQKRPVGRLALFVRRAEILARVRGQVQKIFNSSVFSDLPSHYRQSINLYVISSTCGGTGTGQFTDLAYLAKQAIQEVRPGISVHSRGLFFLPSAFLETQQVPHQNSSRLRANAYGALTELDYLMQQDVEPDDVDYGDGVVVDRQQRPFQSVYLVGNQTSDGRLFTDFHEIMERSAVHVMIELASPLSETGDARMDNVLTAIDAKGPLQGRGRSYSSFGEEWMELPTARLRVRWQKRLSKQIVERLAGKGQEGATLSLDDSGAFGRLRKLRTAGGLQDYLPKVQAERSVFTDLGEEGLDDSTITGNALALESAADRSLETIAPHLRGTVKQIIAQATEEFWNTVRRGVQDGQLEDLVTLGKATEDKLKKWLTEARMASGDGRSAGWVNALGQRLSEVKPGLLTGRRTVARAQREIVLEAERNAQEEWRRRLQATVADVLDTELPSLLRNVQEFNRKVEAIDRYVQAAGTMVQQRVEPVAAPGQDGGALTDEQIDAAYEAEDRPTRLQKEAGHVLQELLDLSPPTVEGVEEVIWRASGTAVLTLADEFLANVQIAPSSVADRLKELHPLAVFEASWKANPGRKDVERLRFLGLPEASIAQKDEILSLLPREVQLETEYVPHGDPDRVVMTVQDHGFPLFALDEASRLRGVFKQLSAAEQNLCFVLPEPEVRNWSFSPEGASEAKEYFGLALVLGMVRRAGRRWVFNAGGQGGLDTTLGEDQDPGRALQQAIDEFLAGGYATAVRGVLRTREEEDTDGLFRRCTEWVEEQREHETSDGYPDVMRDVTNRVAEYAASIRPF